MSMGKGYLMNLCIPGIILAIKCCNLELNSYPHAQRILVLTKYTTEYQNLARKTNKQTKKTL